MIHDQVLLPFDMASWQIGMGVAIFFMLMFHRWFWFVVFTMVSLYAGTQALANLEHFRITYLIGYTILALVCWSNAAVIGGGSPQPSDKLKQDAPVSDDSEHPDWSPR